MNPLVAQVATADSGFAMGLLILGFVLVSILFTTLKNLL